MSIITKTKKIMCIPCFVLFFEFKKKSVETCFFSVNVSIFKLYKLNFCVYKRNFCVEREYSKRWQGIYRWVHFILPVSISSVLESFMLPRTRFQVIDLKFAVGLLPKPTESILSLRKL